MLYQLTHIIAEKEKKSSSYKDDTLESLSDEKRAKIRRFAKEYVHKVLHRLEKGKHSTRPGSESGARLSPSTPVSTSASMLGGPSGSLANGDGGDEELGMTIGDVMDLSDGDDSEPENLA